jgi:hypothetical protein
MRPALQTCGNCHWPGRPIGDAVKVRRTYGDDEANSMTETIIVLEMGGPDTPTGRGIHWHANPNLRIEYVATDADRQAIPWVQVTRPDGSVQQYAAEGAAPDQVPEGPRRTMGCLDCHNVVAHRIARSAEEAVDRAINAGSVSPSSGR